MKKILTLLLAVACCGIASAKVYEVNSPDGSISVKVNVADRTAYSVFVDGKPVLKDCHVSMALEDGKSFGIGGKVRKTSLVSRKETLDAAVYKKAKVDNTYNELTLSFKEYDLVFRVFDDGAAYRFVSKLQGSHKVLSEEAEFAFAGDYEAYVPYVIQHTETLESQYWNSFENTYAKHPISKWNTSRLAFAPLAVEAENGVRLCITESDLLDYPGMFLYNAEGGSAIKGVFAPYPKDIEQGGHNMLQGIVKTREQYIAAIEGRTQFPWRAVAISREDRQLADNDLVWKLATACENPQAFEWVRPGKVAWDWWNDWNIYGVDFESGINNDTYKYYIDFASANGIEYVILDEGWSVNGKADLFSVVPEIDLKQICDYAAEKNVGIILWAGYWAFDRDMEEVCRHYSEMGVKGFKVDFMDRDDQAMVQFYTRAAATTARYHMLVDFHGAYKPTGLQRTYPNVINFEGVAGLEQLKWSNPDQVTYDVTIPFIRQLAGPMDYTQGAMRNATKGNFKAVYSEAMSQGTRCHQLAEYVVFESPLTMLCDSPSNYMAEPECTQYIAACPTVWDETVAIDGKVGEYVIIARRKGSVWYLGALTNWTGRDLTADLSFLGEGTWKCESFSDGPNAGKAARDFTHKTGEKAGSSISFHLASGGGFAAIFTKAE